MRKNAAILLLVLVYNLYFFPFHVAVPGGLEFVVAQVVLLCALWIVFGKLVNKKADLFALVTSLVALCSAVLSVYESSGVSHFLLGITSLATLTLTTYLLLLRTSQFGSLFEFFVSPLLIGLAWIQQFFQVKWGKGIQISKGARIFRGLIIGFPVILVVIALLTSADPVFNKLVTSVFKDSFPKDLLTRVVYSGVLIIGLLPLAASSIRDGFISPAALPWWKRFTVEIMVVVGMLSLVLGSFLIVQFRYLFASVPETELHQFGINTYSEYTRKGFGELVFVAGIVYVVAGAGYVVFRSSKLLLLQKLNLILISETALFVVSILRRVYLYYLHHGLSRSRVYGSVFVLYVLVLIIFLGFRHLISQKKQWYLAELGVGVLLVFVVTLIKPDYLIATRFPPTVNNEIDYGYLSRLSADAMPGWVEGFRNAKYTLELAKNEKAATPSAEMVRKVFYASETTTNLIMRYRQLAALYGTDEELAFLYDDAISSDYEMIFKSDRKRGWLKKNFANESAYRVLKQSVNVKDLKQLQKDFDSYMETVPDGAKNHMFDRSPDSPLL